MFWGTLNPRMTSYLQSLSKYKEENFMYSGSYAAIPLRGSLRAQVGLPLPSVLWL